MRGLRLLVVPVAVAAALMPSAAWAHFFEPNESWTTSPYYGDKATKFADVDADGKADAIAVNSYGVFVKLSSGSGFGVTRAWAGPFYGSQATNFADVNGDRKADAIAVNSSGVTVRFSTGSAFSSRGTTTPHLTVGTRLRFADVTSDGKADAVLFGASHVTVYYSTGDNFDKGHSWSYNPYYGNVATDCVDVSGDGIGDGIAVNRSKITVRREF